MKQIFVRLAAVVVLSAVTGLAAESLIAHAGNVRRSDCTHVDRKNRSTSQAHRPAVLFDVGGVSESCLDAPLNAPPPPRRRSVGAPQSRPNPRGSSTVEGLKVDVAHALEELGGPWSRPGTRAAAGCLREGAKSYAKEARQNNLSVFGGQSAMLRCHERRDTSGARKVQPVGAAVGRAQPDACGRRRKPAPLDAGESHGSQRRPGCRAAQSGQA